MFPYLEVDVFRAGPLRLSLVRLLLGAGILLGYFLVLRRARQRGASDGVASRLALAMVVSGFIGAHFFKILYFDDMWDRLRGEPWAALAIFSGSASFGGVFGALAGGWLYLRRRGLSAKRSLAYLDLVAFVFPVSLLFGRFGCYLVHDHPGIRTASWLGVRYPDGTRFDLGLLEFFFLALVVVAFRVLDRARRPEGFYFSWFLTAYGAFRWGLDALHVDPVRYWGVTVDQWSAGAAIAVGLLAAWSRLRFSEEVSCETNYHPA